MQEEARAKLADRRADGGGMVRASVVRFLRTIRGNPRGRPEAGGEKSKGTDTAPPSLACSESWP